MSLWADYIKERNGMETVEDEYGFLTFVCLKEECYLEDIYVAPLKRRSGHGKILLDRVEIIAREKGCKYLTGSIRPKVSSTATDSMRAHLAVGFKIYSASSDLIVMMKELV